MENERPAEPAPPVLVHQMTLSFWSDGQFTLEGIPAQALIAYGMLGLAGEVLAKHRREQEEARRARIVRPNGQLPGLLRGPR